MTHTTPQAVGAAQGSNKGQTPSVSPASRVSTIGVSPTQLDAILPALAEYSDAKGKRPRGLDPLDGLSPDPTAFAPGKTPISRQTIFTLFDALSSTAKLFAADAAVARGSMDMMSTVSGIMMGMLKQQQAYQNQVTELNASIKADQPPLVLKIFEDIFTIALGAVMAFMIGGPYAAVAAVVIGITLDVLSQAKVIGKGDKKESVFQYAFKGLSPAAQIGIKLGIAVALAAIIGGAAFASVGTEVAEVASEELESIAMDDLSSVAEDGLDGAEEDPNADSTEQSTSAPNAGKRALGLFLTNMVTIGNQIESEFKYKDKDGHTETVELGLFGDIFKSAGASNELAGWLQAGVSLVASLVGNGGMGYFLGTVPDLMSNTMQKVMGLITGALAVGQGGTQIYSGAKNVQISQLLDELAGVQFLVGNVQTSLQATQFTQHLAETMMERDVTGSSGSLNTVMGILDSIQAATGLNQAV